MEGGEAATDSDARLPVQATNERRPVVTRIARVFSKIPKVPRNRKKRCRGGATESSNALDDSTRSKARACGAYAQID